MAEANTKWAKIADKATAVACKQLKTGIDFRQPRFDDIKKNEDMYVGRAKPALAGRFNVPIDGVVMEGFIDTLMSEIDTPPKVEFAHTKEMDLKSSQKVTASWEDDTSETKGNLRQKDLDMKKLASLSGRGFIKSFGEPSPWRFHMETVDHYDMVTEPKGGRYLDNHLFKYQLNIFRTNTELQDGIDEGRYVASQVKLLRERSSDQDSKKNEDLFKNKVFRMESFGLDMESHEYVGQNMFNLTEGVFLYKGHWYYIVFDYPTGTWVRFERTSEVFDVAKEIPGRGPWTSWATHIDPFVFWSKASADSVRPIAESMRIIFNQTLENIQKRNWDMTAYDSNMFPDPSKLMWRRGGLAKAVIKDGRSIGNGIYKFQTPDTTSITINLMSFLDQFVGLKTGINAGLQGQAEEDKVGIAVANLQQAKGRLGLTNSQYSQAYIDLATSYDYALAQHLRDEEKAVERLGTKGVEWEQLVLADTKPKFRIRVTGGNAEDEANAMKSISQERALNSIRTDPVLSGFMNPMALIEHILKTGQMDDEKIRVLMDTQNYGTQELLSEAAKAIDDIRNGREDIKLNRGATTAFQSKIEAYAYDNTDDDFELFQKLIAYSEAHDEIVKENTERKAREMQRLIQTLQLTGGKTPANPTGTSTEGEPVPEGEPLPV